MPTQGDVYTNPVTGERCVVRAVDEEADPARVLVDLHVSAGWRVAGAHVHPSFSERFEVLAGRVGLRVGDEQGVGGPGTVRDVPPGTVHDWWNAGEDEAHVLVEVRGPIEVLRRFDEMIVTLFGLAHEGRVGRNGMPGLLQTALLADEFSDVIRFVRPPFAVQRALFKIVAPIARRTGRRATYPQHRALVVQR
jgi:mannose-6-phosphate isomerase-like protein (cupin superfamily)